jgi:hypothetical protein
LFTQFYRLRDSFLKAPHVKAELLATARSLAERSEEAALIIGHELRQVSRVTGQEVNLV